MHFANWIEADDYARKNNFSLVWGGTQAFIKRKKLTPHNNFHLHTVTTRKGVATIALFPDEILHGEAEADAERRDRLAKRRQAGFDRDWNDGFVDGITKFVIDGLRGSFDSDNERLEAVSHILASLISHLHGADRAHAIAAVETRTRMILRQLDHMPQNTEGQT